jgi:Zn-dependent protease with chaperone function
MSRMHRFRGLSVLEANLLLSGLVLILAGAGAAVVAWDTGDLRRAVGTAGLVALVLGAIARGVRLYRAGTRAALPTAVGRVPMRVRPARGFGLIAVTVALALPLAAAAVALATVEWAWLLLAGVLLVGVCAAAVTSGRDFECSHPLTSELLARLCMRADMAVPELVVEPGPANAWTAGGRIHVTWGLLELLEPAELEAVLAHELAADAAAATLTGRPSALASALLKLERESDWAPHTDLRRIDALGIVGVGRSRLLSTHPPTSARVRQLEAIEARLR